MFDNIEDLNYQIIEGNLDLFNDDSIRIIPTSGHTPGHQSVHLRLGNKKIFIAGGSSLYNTVFNDMSKVDCIHVSIMNTEYECDRYVKIPTGKLSIITKRDYGQFTHMVLKPPFYPQ